MGLFAGNKQVTFISPIKNYFSCFKLLELNVTRWFFSWYFTRYEMLVPFHCLWFLVSMGQVCWVVFSAWVIGNCTIMNLIYTLLLIDIFAVCCSGSHHEKLGHFQNCLNTRSHSSITCIPLLQNISDRTSTKIHRVKLGQVHIMVYLWLFSTSEQLTVKTGWSLWTSQRTLLAKPSFSRTLRRCLWMRMQSRSSVKTDSKVLKMSTLMECGFWTRDVLLNSTPLTFEIQSIIYSAQANISAELSNTSQESRSGAGSTIKNTQNIIKILHNFVDKFKIYLQKDEIR